MRRRRRAQGPVTPAVLALVPFWAHAADRPVRSRTLQLVNEPLCIRLIYSFCCCCVINGITRS